MSSLAVSASGPAADAVTATLPALVQDRVASRLFARDAGLWGEAAQEEAAIRLGWVDLARASRPLVGEVAAIGDELLERGVDRIVLAGMGGSSLAPEVICAAAGRPLVVLDSSDPDMVRAAFAEGLERTAVVVSSKSGSTVETDSQRRVAIEAFTAAGIDPTERIVVVTDPGSPLEEQSRADGYRVVTADPEVGGRYSALTAFGLVPSGLAGVDIEALLDEAEEVADLLATDDEANPALRLGAAVAGGEPVRTALVLADAGSGLPGLGHWIEQLVAESTGKDGTGLLPVVVASPESPGAADPTPDSTLALLTGEDTEEATPTPEGAAVVTVSGSLGGQFLLWEAATAVAGRLLGINPFDQPDVESAKAAARELLGGSGDAPAEDEADAVTGRDAAAGVAIRGGSDWLSPAAVDSLAGSLDALLARLDDTSGYVAVMVYLDRLALEPTGLDAVRDALGARTGRPVTFGWGPRFLHSTGQLHKGGPRTGVYLQITGAAAEDLAVPGRDFTLGEFIAAQAAGDAQVLESHGRPVLRWHLEDQATGLPAVRAVLDRPAP